MGVASSTRNPIGSPAFLPIGSMGTVTSQTTWEYETVHPCFIIILVTLEIDFTLEQLNEFMVSEYRVHYYRFIPIYQRI
jgi:hypothetical protein